MFEWRVGQIQKMNSGIEKIRGGGGFFPNKEKRLDKLL